MLLALFICNFCYILLVKGVPAWLSVILSIISGVSFIIAAIIWEHTKIKIANLENSVFMLKSNKLKESNMQ